MFLFQKIATPLFFPVTIVFLILVLGLSFSILSRRKRIGTVLILIGVLLLGTLSYESVSEKLLKPLEDRYLPMIHPVNLEDVRWIVVLGGGHTSNPRLSATSQISELSLFRLVEGIRLHHELPGTKLILSGGRVFDPVSEAKGMAEVALVLGVKKENLVLEEVSKDTSDQARLIHELIKEDRFILVTSAAHMPRSMFLFMKLGLHPVPAPTDYQVKEGQGTSPKRFYPTADGLMKSQRAFYEYSVLFWTKIKEIGQRMGSRLRAQTRESIRKTLFLSEPPRPTGGTFRRRSGEQNLNRDTFFNSKPLPTCLPPRKPYSPIFRCAGVCLSEGNMSP